MFHELSFVFVDVQMSSFTVANLHFERTKSTLPLTNTLQAGALTAEEQKAPATIRAVAVLRPRYPVPLTSSSLCPPQMPML